MNSLLNILIFSFHVIQSRSEPSTIMSHHPGIMDHFLEISRRREHLSQKTFRGWEIDQKLYVCEKLIDSVSFYALKEGEKRPRGPVSYSADNLLYRLRFLHDFGEMDDVNYTVVTANVKNKPRDVVTHLCIADPTYQSAFTTAYHDNVYFYLDKTDSASTTFRLSAIADPKALVHPIINYDFKRLTYSYVDNLFILLGQNEYFHNFCALSQFKKFRMCNLAYVSLMQQRGETIDGPNYVGAKTAGSCARQANILIETGFSFYYLTTDLISCAIESASSSTIHFYLTADPRRTDAAYVLRKVEMTPRNLVQIGDFSGKNKYDVDFARAKEIVSSFQWKMRSADVEGMNTSEKGTARETGKDEDLIRGRIDETKTFYRLEMYVMKLTPLLDFDDGTKKNI